MQIRAGYEIAYECPQPTPMVLLLTSTRPICRTSPRRIKSRSIPPSRRATTGTPTATCARAWSPRRGVSPSRRTSSSNDTGAPDIVEPDAEQIAIQELPDDVLVYLLGSRYCDTDHLATQAWSLFGNGPTGWGRVQAICDYVNEQAELRLPACLRNAHGLGRLPRAARRVPRFCAPCRLLCAAA